MANLLEVRAETAEALQRLRSEGAGPSELARYLAAQGVEDLALCEHFMQAFALELGDARAVITWAGSHDDAALDAALGSVLEQSADRWPTFPGVIRPADREVFRAVAAELDAVLVVCGASPLGAFYVGAPRYRVCPFDVVPTVRDRAPGGGLVCAAPGDPARAEPWGDYVRRLAASGLEVAGEPEGYIVRAAGCEGFYQGYHVHGAYRAGTGRNAWSERMRAMLNFGLREELVPWGPQDLWVHRNDRDRAGFRFGPQPPAILYLPDGSALNLLDAAQMRSAYRWLRIDWEAIYPEDGA